MVDVFHIGPPKTATTWLYKCMAEHPEFRVTRSDTVHYYDMFYAYGDNWYEKQFVESSVRQKKVDATPSYIQSRTALERLVRDNPNARIIIGLREPVERAFSHYWHLKKKGYIRHEFREILDNYTLFSLWLEAGFIARNIGPLVDNIPRERIYLMKYDDLKINSAEELKNIFRFCGVDESFEPTVLRKRVNIAGPRQHLVARAAHKVRRAALRDDERGGSFGSVLSWLSGKSEYDRGVPRDVVDQLAEICEPEIVAIEDVLGVDLSDWRWNGGNVR